MWYIGRKKVRRKSAKRRNYVPRAFCLPRHYEVRGPGEAHKLGIIETNVQEKNACFTTERKI